MGEGIMQDKVRLRRKLRALISTLPAAYIANTNLEIEARLLALEAWEQAKAVFIYISTEREPQTRGAAQAALNEGKTLAVPRIIADGEMEARIITSLDDLCPGKYGILEPGPSAPLLQPEAMDLVVVPCIAADRRGFRLGHGGGYYDRYLAKTKCTTVCLCRERLLQAGLPHGIRDIPVNLVLTEQGLIEPNRR